VGLRSGRIAHTRKAWLCFLDESAVSLTPLLRRTWAPRGVTPVLRDRQRYRPKVSMVGLLCYRPDGSAARLLFGFHRGSYDTAALVKVLTGLHAFLGGAPVNLIWDARIDRQVAWSAAKSARMAW
jgi:hypothetical protein